MSGDLVFLDVETTGLFSSDRVVSLAAIRVGRDDVLRDDFDMRHLHLVFDPGRKSHPRAEEVHGLDDWFLRHQSPFSDSAHLLSELLAEKPTIVAHNVAFDRQFIEREFEKAGIALECAGYACTMQAYRASAPGRKASLGAILPQIGMERAGEKHGAFEDAWLALQVWRWLNGAKPRPFPGQMPSFANARPAPPRPEILPRRSSKNKKLPPPPPIIPDSIAQLRPLAMVMDYVAKSDGRIESEVAVLTDLILSAAPETPGSLIPDIVAGWISEEFTLHQVREALAILPDRQMVADWIKRVVYADSAVSAAELQAVNELLKK